MNKNGIPQSESSSTGWLLLATLALAIGAGALALHSTMDGTAPSGVSPPQATEQAQEAGALPDTRPAGTVQGAISSRMETPALPQISPEVQAPPLPDPAPSHEAEAGARTPDVQEGDSAAGAAVDQAGPGAPGAEQAQAPDQKALDAPGQAPHDADGTLNGASGAALAEADRQKPLPEAGNAAEARQSPPDAAGQAASNAAEKAAATSSPDAAPDNGGLILYGKGKPVNAGHSAVRGDIPAGQKPFGRSGTFARQGRGDYVLGPAFVDDLACFLADNYWPEGSHPMARGRGLSTASVKLANMRYGARLEGFAVNQGDPVRARHQVLSYAYMPSMLRALYVLYADLFFSNLENRALDRASGPQGIYFTNAQMADFFSGYAGMARSLGACAGAFRDNPGIRTQAASYAQAHDAASAAYARFIDSMDGSAEQKHLASAAYYEAVRRRESGAGQLAAALGREGGKGLDADSRVYLALWLLRRGPENTAALSVLQEICLDGARRLDELAGHYKNLPGRQIARP